MPKRGPPPPVTKRKSHPSTTPSPTPTPTQVPPSLLSDDQKTAMRNAAVAVGVSVAVLLLSYMLLPKLFSFPTAPVDRLIFVIRAEVLVFVWVVVAFRIVSANHFYGTPAAGSPRPQAGEQRSALHQFAQNTLEQAVVALVAHLALATLLEGAAMALIVGAIVLFTIGRATFVAGMRFGADVRALGMMITTLPNVLCYCVAVILLIAQALSFGE